MKTNDLERRCRPSCGDWTGDLVRHPMRGVSGQNGAGGSPRGPRKAGPATGGSQPSRCVHRWPAIDLGAITVETGPESWASFLQAAAADELAAALAELNNAAGGLP